MELQPDRGRAQNNIGKLEFSSWFSLAGMLKSGNFFIISPLLSARLAVGTSGWSEILCQLAGGMRLQRYRGF